MNSQESMFDEPERTSYRAQQYNAEPHERQEQAQWQEGEEEGYEGYAERSTPYTDGGMRQIGDGKVRPQGSRPQRTNWIVALAVGIPLLFFIALGGIGFAFGRTDRTRGWDGDQRGWDGPQSGWNKRMHSGEPQLFNVSAQPTLIITDVSGTVHIHTGDTGQIIVQSQGLNDARSKFSGAQSNYDPESNTVNINAQSQSGFPFDNNNADLEITAPAASNIQVQTVSGNIEVDGVNGQLTLNTGSGTVTANDVSGQMTVNAGSGDVRVSGKLQQGQSILKTDSGDITFNGVIDPQGSYLFETGSGDVNLSLPNNSSFSLNTKTDSGEVSNDFRDATVGSNPHAQLSINTNSGSIKLQREQ
jgi:hypothetical protein